MEESHWIEVPGDDLMAFGRDPPGVMAMRDGVVTLSAPDSKENFCQSMVSQMGAVW